MKKRLPTAVKIQLLSCAAVSVLCAARAAAAELPVITARTNHIADVVVERKSVFNPAAPGARDPFYPDAVRMTKTTGPDAGETSVTAFSLLTLSGIVSGRSAIINNRNFVPGDEAPVLLRNGARVTIKVVEVNEDSVKVTINGQKEPKTLYARGATAR